jgi:hypothetical protein
MCPYDLFGEIPVTESDIYAWVSAVAPRWLTPERSYRGYVQNWNVADKVRTAKLRGEFDQIIEQQREPWHARLALASIV